MKKYIILLKDEITRKLLDETKSSGGVNIPSPILMSDEETESGYCVISVFDEYADVLKGFKRLDPTEFAAQKAAIQAGNIPDNKIIEVVATQNRPSNYQVSLRIEGDNWSCPANTATTHYVALNDDYEIRGAEFQFVNGKAGDFVEVWITDKDGILYPAGTRLTKYVNKFCVYDHASGTQAWVADLVDDDTSDLVPSVFYLEFVYTNNQAALSPDVKAIVNFWMYKRA